MIGVVDHQPRRHKVPYTYSLIDCVTFDVQPEASWEEVQAELRRMVGLPVGVRVGGVRHAVGDVQFQCVLRAVNEDLKPEDQGERLSLHFDESDGPSVWIRSEDVIAAELTAGYVRIDFEPVFVVVERFVPPGPGAFDRSALGDGDK
jgi:hypothetical protein